MKEEDKNAIRAELSNVQNASNPMVKQAAIEKLNDLTEKYGLFTHGYMFNIVGHDSSDPVRANKALVVFNQFMAALNEHNVAKAREILDANIKLLEGVSIPQGPGSIHLGGGQS